MLDQEHHPSLQSLRALDWLNFFFADVLTGVVRFSPSILRRRSTGISPRIGGRNPKLPTQA